MKRRLKAHIYQFEDGSYTVDVRDHANQSMKNPPIGMREPLRPVIGGMFGSDGRYAPFALRPARVFITPVPKQPRKDVEAYAKTIMEALQQRETDQENEK